MLRGWDGQSEKMRGVKWTFFPVKESLVRNLNSSEPPREVELVYLALVLSTLPLQFFLLSLVLPYHLWLPFLFLLYNLQAKLKSIESQLNEALNASDTRSTIGSEATSVISSPKIMESTADSSSVTKRLEEELAKRDALIEV